MDKCKILFPVGGCRSDEFNRPIFRRLYDNNLFDTIILPLKAANFVESYKITQTYIDVYKPDIIFITGDRIEATAAACCAFQNNIPIVHYGAGITNYPQSTLDDINRHCITLWSDIYMTTCEQELINAEKLRLFLSYGVGYNVGITHLDDLVIDESVVPSESYDLVLINPTTTMEEIVYIESDFAIIIGHNPDDTTLHVVNIEKVKDYRYFDNFLRHQFMGLLKNCKRFITNSSAAYYEAPFFLKSEQIILIGERNKNRSTPTKLETGASQRIVKILEKWWISKNV